MLAQHTIGEVAELVRRQVPQVLMSGADVIPDPVLELPYRRRVNRPVDLEDGLVLYSLRDAESLARVTQHALEVQLGQRSALDDADVQMLITGPGRSRTVEADDEIGEPALRGYMGGHVRLPGSDLRVDLLLRVSPLGYVALHLPPVLELRFRVEPDVQVEQSSDARDEEGVQSLDDHYLLWLDLVRRPECAVGVVVHGLHDRISPLEF